MGLSIDRKENVWDYINTDLIEDNTNQYIKNTMPWVDDEEEFRKILERKQGL